MPDFVDLAHSSGAEHRKNFIVAYMVANLHNTPQEASDSFDRMAGVKLRAGRSLSYKTPLPGPPQGHVSRLGNSGSCERAIGDVVADFHYDQFSKFFCFEIEHIFSDGIADFLEHGR